MLLAFNQYIQKELSPSVKQATLWIQSLFKILPKEKHPEKVISSDCLLQNSGFSPTVLPVGISLGYWENIVKYWRNLLLKITQRCCTILSFPMGISLGY